MSGTPRSEVLLILVRATQSLSLLQTRMISMPPLMPSSLAMCHGNHLQYRMPVNAQRVKFHLGWTNPTPSGSAVPAPFFITKSVAVTSQMKWTMLHNMSSPQRISMNTETLCWVTGRGCKRMNLERIQLTLAPHSVLLSCAVARQLSLSLQVQMSITLSMC